MQQDETVVSTPKAEHHRDALGIGESRPRLSWHAVTAPPDWRQVAYEIEATDPATGETVTSGRVDSAESVLVPWPFPELRSRERRAVRVRVWGAADESAWSPVLDLETGLLNAADWSAVFVTPDWDEDTSVDQPPPLLRGEFESPGEIATARLYITALGLYEASLNDQRVGEDAFTPGWTSYSHRLRYQTYDVTSLIHNGLNTLVVQLADGWYRGRLGFDGGTRDIYGSQLAALAQLEITHQDGTRQTFASGPSWQAAQGPIRMSGIYDGERHDARIEPTAWSNVQVLDQDLNVLVAPAGPAVRCTAEIRPAGPLGRIVDFGQNLVGRVRVRVRGARGTSIRLRHAEVLQDGEVYVRPLRKAEATDEYVLRGDGEEVWEPRFTFHGFRYVEVTGDAEVIDLVARVYHTDMVPTGRFTCSDPLVDRLHDNVVWSMRGNFLDVPTDCPQRDERLGWTGDIQVFATTAAFLYDCAGMLSSWLQDVAAEQLDDGTVPFFVPSIPAPGWVPPFPAAVWGDVAVLTPWDLYQRFGDVEILRRQYSSAKAWVDCVSGLTGPDHVWDTGHQLGDWLDPSAPAHDPADAKADRHLIATAYYYRSVSVLSDIAGVLGLAADQRDYARLASRIRAGFTRRWIRPSGLLTNDAQASYALALRFGLIAPQQQDVAGRRLAELVSESGHHIATGFAGTPAISDALTTSGHADTAYALLLQQGCPSWLYPVTQGATTIWERWDSLLPDGTVNPGEMTSFNHYALGAVADWLHRTVAGLAPAAPGYRRILVEPRPGHGITHASAQHMTPYGLAEVGWQLNGTTLHLDLTVPPNTTAEVRLPGQAPEMVGSGRHSWSSAVDSVQV